VSRYDGYARTRHTARVALSRWRHGFESRWGCDESAGESPPTGGLFALPGRVAHHLPMCRPGSVLTGDRRKGGYVQGNIRQRGAASWELRVFVGRDPVTGRRRYATKTVRGGKREAQRELASLLHSAHQGALARSSSTVRIFWRRGSSTPSPICHRRPSARRGGTSTAILCPAWAPCALIGYERPRRRLLPTAADEWWKGWWSTVVGHDRRIHGMLRRALQQGVQVGDGGQAVLG